MSDIKMSFTNWSLTSNPGKYKEIAKKKTVATRATLRGAKSATHPN